jgi:hypothetical protein
VAIRSAVVENKLVVVGQGTTRMTGFSRPESSTGGTAFARDWSSFNGGSEGTGVSPIAASGRFSGRLAIVEGIVFASVTVDGAAAKGSCLRGTAELHFYNLNSGTFPTGLIVNKETGDVITGKVVIGTGDALGVAVTQVEGGSLGVYAAAQAPGGAGAAGGSTRFDVRAPTARVVWWKEVERDSY